MYIDEGNAPVHSHRNRRTNKELSSFIKWSNLKQEDSNAMSHVLKNVVVWESL